MTNRKIRGLVKFMRIEKIRLENFRCFEELEVAFREDYTILVGVNGAGKSSILEAVSIA